MAIAIIGMLDERERVLSMIKDGIEKRGHRTMVIDISIGTGGTVPTLQADVPSSELASLGGRNIEDVKAMIATERDGAIGTMVAGLTEKIGELHRSGELEGVIAVGGMTGTFMSLSALSTLPFGLPKLLISSVAAMPVFASQLVQFLGQKDILMMSSVVDMVGMNLPVRTVAVNGANAIAGMVESAAYVPDESKTSIVITEFNFCDEGAHYVRKLLGDRFDIVSFHAQGVGDRAAVNFVRQGGFQGFIDLVPASFSEYLLGGNRASGIRRLDLGKDLLIPYILSPCGFDMISCGPIDRKDKGDHLWESRKLAGRKLFLQDAVRVQARTSPEEMEQIAGAVAERLNRYTYKEMVKFIIPLKGFSSLSMEGAALYDPDSDLAFITTLRKHLDPKIEIVEVDTDINSRDFARAVAGAFDEALSSKPRPESGKGISRE